MAFGQLSAKGHALRLLARREHSRAELERKLARKLVDGTARAGAAADADAEADADATTRIAGALDDLAAKGLLSDERVAESVLNGAGRRLGVHRLRQALQAKGLAGELVDATLHQAGATEADRARQVWQRKFGTPPADAAERARQMRFLLSRGFDAEVAQRVVRGSVADDDDD